MSDTLDLARLLGDADKFIRHTGLCGIVGGYGYCTCGMEEAREALASRISELESALRRIEEFERKFRQPWGAWKTVWWEGEVSDEAAFTADNALMHIANIARNVLGERA